MEIDIQSQNWATWYGNANALAVRLAAGCWAMAAMCGCHSMQGMPESWAAVNTVQSARSAPQPVDVAIAPRPSQLTLKQAIDTLVPPIYRLDVAEDLNLNTSISVDTSKNWLEALGQGLSEANIEFITNLHSKSATIRWSKIVLSQVIKTCLPPDFTVYAEAGIDLQSVVRFDTRQYWAEALSHSALDNGIALTINYGSKVIALRRAHPPQLSQSSQYSHEVH